ncbi:MAG: MarR family transcriptional regulator [bacterium]|nr:MarR family transcriptional regulator [bacterium]
MSLEEDIGQFWTLLFQIVADMEKRLTAHFGRHSLTPPQFYVLKTLAEHGGSCPIGEIAREHHLTNATMTGLIKRLEGTKLVCRERSTEDRRSVVVQLTEEGWARFAAVQRDLLEQVGVILSLLDDQSRHDLITYAARYIEDVVKRFPVSALQTNPPLED